MKRATCVGHSAMPRVQTRWLGVPLEAPRLTKQAAANVTCFRLRSKWWGPNPTKNPKMARADTICSRGCRERGRALPGTRVLQLHALCEHVPVPCLVVRPLLCSCPALQTQRSTQTQRLHACVPCTCLRGPLVRACPAPAGACLPCACACTLSSIRSACSIAVNCPLGTP